MTNIEKVCQFFDEYPGHLKTAKKEIAERLNVHPTDIDKAKKLIREGQEPSYTDLDEFAQQQGFDPENASMVWYKGQGFSVAVKNKKAADPEELLEFLKDYSYSPPPPTNYYNENRDPVVSSLNLFDAHIDKLSYTGKGGFEEIETNIDVLFQAVAELAKTMRDKKVTHVTFPIGNDFFNTNGSINATKAGTPQSIATQWQRSFEAGVTFYRLCIDYLAQFFNVHIVDIPGNHDEDKVFYLGQVIKAVYEGHSRVTMELNRDVRKYAFFGNVLIGYGHGKREKKNIKNLPSIMSMERPKLWGEAKHRVWILGDIHHKDEFKTQTGFEHNGADIEFFRGACDTDEWHYQEGWIGAKKSVSCIIYSMNGNRIFKDELFI